MTATIQRITLLLMTTSVVFCIAGCGASDSAKKNESAAENENVARTKIERGPVRVDITVSPHPARLSDEPTMTLTIDFERGVEVDKPPFGEAIGDFVIRDFHEPLPETKGDREIIRQIYTLEPTRSGKSLISPIAIQFTDNRENGDKQKHTVETEALEIEIASVLDADAPSLDDLVGRTDPVELPKPRTSEYWAWMIVLVIVAAVAIVIWLLRRGRRHVVERQLSPQEMAYLELDQLVRENISESDVKEFYVRLTGIVRRYIERTTEVHAPEQTTEEFLREISNGNTFSRDETDRLKSFLESADLVKFAAHDPTAVDIENTFERAKTFIGLESQGVAA